MSTATPCLLIRCPQPSPTAHQLCQGQTAPRHPALVRLPCDPAHTTSRTCFCVGRTTLKLPPGPAHVPSHCWPRGRFSGDARPAGMSSPGHRPFLPSRMVTADASAENQEDMGASNRIKITCDALPGSRIWAEFSSCFLCASLQLLLSSGQQH